MQAMLKGHENIVSAVAFSPNGRSLVSASYVGSIRIWNIRDGSSEALPVIGLPEYFISVVFSPDGRFVAAGHLDGSLWIFDSRTHRLVAKWRGHTDGVWCTEFMPDGQGLISGGYDKTVKYWDVSLLGNRQGVSTGMVLNEELRLPFVRTFLGHDVCFFLPLRHNVVTFVTQGPVCSIALFPDNAQWIVTGSSDKSVRVWDSESGVCQLTLEGHTEWVYGCGCQPDARFPGNCRFRWSYYDVEIQAAVGFLPLQVLLTSSARIYQSSQCQCAIRRSTSQQSPAPTAPLSLSVGPTTTTLIPCSSS